ncbi:MAG: DUF4392 domain-containing protein [Oscillospiraceae bacterium]|jgi:hypothetical protein|nr:DUF4392 domain-containing protein [Oscillospiraceae bacterium]
MNKLALQSLNIGQNLDDLMNLDPRGYGVCRILYPAARAYTGKPLSLNAAEQLVQTVKKNDVVYILTGFILLPHKHAEMDGIVSSVLLCRALVKAFEAKPVIICPEDCIEAVKKLSLVAGLHLYDSVAELQEYPQALAAIPFTKKADEAEACANSILSAGLPRAVVSIECPGANKQGVYHNATGLDMSALEAKTDMLFQKLADAGVMNIAVGDLGNETGMGTIAEHLKEFVPYMAESEGSTCRCGCAGGILAATKAQNIITATVSDWGCYALIAALAFLCENMDILHTPETEKRALYVASEAGMVDMDGWLLPQIDGMSCDINMTIVNLMYLTVKNALDKRDNFDTWYEKVLELNFFK